MKKAILFTLSAWAITLAGYAQTMRTLPLPKGLQCNDIPTWPVTHNKKSNSDTNPKAATSTNAPAAGNSSNKPVTALPVLPVLKFWLIADAGNNNKAED